MHPYTNVNTPLKEYTWVRVCDSNPSIVLEPENITDEVLEKGFIRFGIKLKKVKMKLVQNDNSNELQII